MNKKRIFFKLIGRRRETRTFLHGFLKLILHIYCLYQKFIYPSRSTTSHGQIFCSGENKVGRQREPCIFTLRTASKYLIRENRFMIVLFVDIIMRSCWAVFFSKLVKKIHCVKTCRYYLR